MTKSDINQGKTEIIKPLEVRLIKKSRLESSPNSTPPPIQKSEYQLLKPNTEPSLQDYPKHSAISIPIKTYYKISELDVIPQPTIPIEPEYPVSVPPSVQSGIVRLELFLDEDGMVTDINILNSHPQEYFEEAAKKAFLHAQFTPGIKEGKKVKCVMTLQVHFGNN